MRLNKYAKKDSLPRRTPCHKISLLPLPLATNCVRHVTGKSVAVDGEKEKPPEILFASARANAPKIAKQFEKMSRNLKLSRRI